MRAHALACSPPFGQIMPLRTSLAQTHSSRSYPTIETGSESESTARLVAATAARRERIGDAGGTVADTTRPGQVDDAWSLLRSDGSDGGGRRCRMGTGTCSSFGAEVRPTAEGGDCSSRASLRRRVLARAPGPQHRVRVLRKVPLPRSWRTRLHAPTNTTVAPTPQPAVARPRSGRFCGAHQ